MSSRAFLDAYVRPEDPRCKVDFDARYAAEGPRRIRRHAKKARRFFRKWPLADLKKFLPKAEQAGLRTYEDLYEAYVDHYARTVARLQTLKTPAGTALVRPGASLDRSFVAWICALERQTDYDVVITNTFILSDLLTEPHPHAALARARVGGIAARSPARSTLGGQALLASTFGIDTALPGLAELTGPDGRPRTATPEERARILGAFLLAHEVGHAMFGIPDNFDHPLGCLMATRPGATYLEGLVELDTHRAPCPRCRTYVQARADLEGGRAAVDRGDFSAGRARLKAALTNTPKAFHGSRRTRIAEIVVELSRAEAGLGRRGRARILAERAVDISPRLGAARAHLRALEAPRLRPGGRPVLATRTASTATISGE